MSPEAARVQADPVVKFRLAVPSDGAPMWALVKEMGGLELNSAYFYVLFCTDFADSCVVAEVDGVLAGFVVGYRPPARSESIFVWQIGVAPWMRRQGLAGRLLEALLDQQHPPVRWLEATVTPDNEASRSLFRALARKRQTGCEERAFMDASLFPVSHEAEDLFYIGPLTPHSSPEVEPS